MLFIFPYLFSGLVFADVKYSVSGMSSGGYMTGQLHIAHSSSITGAAIIAAGPYYCTQGTFDRVYGACFGINKTIDISPSADYIRNMSAQGLIDPLSSLSRSKVYIFSGSKDEYLTPEIVGSTYDLYRKFISRWQINFEKSIPANHAWPTMNNGNACDYLGNYYVNKCGYDASGILLRKLLGTLRRKGKMNLNNLFRFSQADYADIQAASIGSIGFIYVPTNCQANPKGCRIHVTIHGCQQNYENIGTIYMEQIDIMPWAESNKIIVIFPQTQNSEANQKTGCWDFWGYTRSDFALKSGLQVSAIHNMAQDYVNIAKKVVK